MWLLHLETLLRGAVAPTRREPAADTSLALLPLLSPAQGHQLRIDPRPPDGGLSAPISKRRAPCLWTTPGRVSRATEERTARGLSTAR